MRIIVPDDQGELLTNWLIDNGQDLDYQVIADISQAEQECANEGINVILLDFDNFYDKNKRFIKELAEDIPDLKFIYLLSRRNLGKIKTLESAGRGIHGYFLYEAEIEALWDVLDEINEKTSRVEEITDDPTNLGSMNEIDLTSSESVSFAADNKLDDSHLIRVDEMGFNEEEKLEKFSESKESTEIQNIFNQAEEKEQPHFEQASELSLSNEEDNMASDKELDLDSDGLELSLGDSEDIVQSSEASGDGDLELSDGGDFNLSLSDEPSVEEDIVDEGLNELSLDDDFATDLNEGEDVIEELSLSEDMGEENSIEFGAKEVLDDELDQKAKEKLQEIEEYMTSTSVAQAADLEMLKNNPASNEDDLSIEPEGLDELALDDDLSLGEGELSESADFSLGEEEASNEPQDDIGFDLSLDEDSSAEEEINFSHSEPVIQESKNVTASEKFSSQQSVNTFDSEKMAKDYSEVIEGHHSELDRLKAMLNSLRSDRENLENKIDYLERELTSKESKLLTVKAELDEKKIECDLLQKRVSRDISDVNFKLNLSEDKNKILEAKLRSTKEELLKWQQKLANGSSGTRNKEQELEQKLELLRIDSENQIRSRENKILELKRRIDTMEFDMENIIGNEKRISKDKVDVEHKLDTAIQALRSTITLLEEGSVRESVEKIKKNLDI